MNTKNNSLCLNAEYRGSHADFILKLLRSHHAERVAGRQAPQRYKQSGRLAQQHDCELETCGW
jgi:hypothetical protein